MKIGYLRVSTEGQNLDRQEVIMQKLGVEKLYMEKLSGKNANRPELQRMLGDVKEGDTVIVESYSRLGRSTVDVLQIVNELQNKGVGFVSQKENIETLTPQGKLIMTVFAGLAEFERTSMIQRVREGCAVAKTKGIYSDGNHKGRWRTQIDATLFEKLFNKWEQNKITQQEAADQLNITRFALRKRFLERQEIGKKYDPNKIHGKFEQPPKRSRKDEN